jgi:aldehyde:ferredoxin oxidoreductase
MMFGYGGKILQIDLTEEKTNVDFMKKDDAEKFIGGIGLGIKLVYDNIKPHVDALGPENLLVLTTGPLSGIMAPAGYGHAFVSKSPLTGGIGVSTTMGFFAGDMKKAGYDAIIFKGRSRKP